MKNLIYTLTLVLSITAIQAQADRCSYSADVPAAKLQKMNDLLRDAVITAAYKDPVGLQQGKFVELNSWKDSFRLIISETGKLDSSNSKTFDNDLADLLIVCKGDNGQEVMVNLAGALLNSGVACTDTLNSIPPADRNTKCEKVK